MALPFQGNQSRIQPPNPVSGRPQVYVPPGQSTYAPQSTDIVGGGTRAVPGQRPSIAPQRARQAPSGPFVAPPVPPTPTGAAQDPSFGWGNAHGRSENLYDSKDWNQPGQAQQYWNANSGAFNGKANLNGYYDNAMKRGTEQLGNKFRASGMFGGSGDQYALGDFGSSLMAEKANREADFNLQSTKAGFESSLGLDSNARANDYYRSQAAATADSAFRNRENDRFNQLMDVLGATSSIYGNGINGGFEADQNAFDSANNAGAASAAGITNQNHQEGQDFLQVLGMGAKAYDAYQNTPRSKGGKRAPDTRLTGDNSLAQPDFSYSDYGDGYMTPDW